MICLYIKHKDINEYEVKRMKRHYFMKTNRIGFSTWDLKDMQLAERLWGNKHVSRYICANGVFNKQDIEQRVCQEIKNEEDMHIEYWPIFELTTNAFIGCCGLRPYKENEYEIGFHLCPEFWGKGYAFEAASAVIKYAFTMLNTEKLFAGHNPNNATSKKLLHKLGFTYIGDVYYAPTKLYHPSYELMRESVKLENRD